MGKIFCLMGKSSSGKDTIFKELNEDKELNLKPIVSYTTRPKRINETDGVEYFFIDKNQLDKYKEENKVIEQRVYHTVDGDWYYCTINDKQIDLEIDGKQHLYRAESDKKRDAFISRTHIVYRVLWNDIRSDTGKAIMRAKIDSFIKFYNEL